MILSQSNASATLSAMTANLGTNTEFAIYDGTVPAGPDTALSGNTLLVSGQVSSWATPTYNASTSGMASSGTMSSGSYSPSASGVASFARLMTSGGTAEIQLTVGTSGAEVILGNTTIQTGVPVTMSMQLTVPSQSV